MASGGRILHHLFRRLPDPKATIIFPGYQGAGTLGYVLVHDAHQVRIMGDNIPVKATIVNLSGSARTPTTTNCSAGSERSTEAASYAVHGEPESAAALVEMAESGFGWQADVAHRGTTATI